MINRYGFREWLDGMGDIVADPNGRYCMYSEVATLDQQCEAHKSFIEDLLKKNALLEHSLKVEREETKRLRQRTGTGRWM